MQLLEAAVSRGPMVGKPRENGSSQRVPLFPETASLEHLAKAAGKAAADAIIASTPLAQAPQTPGGQGAAQKPQNDEAGSDPTGPSSSASSGPSSNAASGVAKAVPKAASGVAEAVPAASGVAEAFPVASGVAEAGPAASGSSQGAVAMDTSVPHSRVDDRGATLQASQESTRFMAMLCRRTRVTGRSGWRASRSSWIRSVIARKTCGTCSETSRR